MSNSSSESRLRRRLVNGGTPVTFLVDVDGQLTAKTFIAKDFTDLDTIELDEWCRRQYVNSIHQLTDGLDKESSDAIYANAIQLIAATTWTSVEGIRVINTPDGWAQLTWRYLRQNHPELTVEEVRAILLNPRNEAESQRTLNELRRASEEAIATYKAQKKTANQSPRALSYIGRWLVNMVGRLRK